MFQPKKILVPTDFSTHSDRAFDVALSIASRYQARVFLLHVVSGLIQQCARDYCIDNNIVDRFVSECIVFANEKLKEIVTRNHNIGNVKVIPDVCRGQPYEEILREASEREIELLVIASHGKSSFNNCFMGSVVERVIKDIKCPVLLLKGSERKEVST